MTVETITIKSDKRVPTCTGCGHPTNGKGVWRRFDAEDQIISDSLGALRPGKHLVHKAQCPSGPPPHIVYSCSACGQEILEKELAFDFKDGKWDAPVHGNYSGCPKVR